MWSNYHAQCIYLCNANAHLNTDDSQLHVKEVQGSVLFRIKLKVRVGYRKIRKVWRASSLCPGAIFALWLH